MCEDFILRKTEKGDIAGYAWPLDDPKKVVCIVHGIGEHAGRYRRVAAKFGQAGIATISMDLRGHGKSMNKKGHCAPRKDILEDVSEMLLYARKRYPVKDIVLYGHSMGGNIALDYRSRGAFNDIPAKYLISAPWVRLVNPVEGAMYTLAKVMSRIAPSAAINNGVDAYALGNPGTASEYVSDPMVHNKISFLCAVEGIDIGKELEDGTNEDNGKANNTPTMLMHGTDDRVCSIEGTRRVFDNLKAAGANVDMIEWEGLFHEIHNGNASSNGDEVVDRIIKFILE